MLSNDYNLGIDLLSSYTNLGWHLVVVPYGTKGPRTPGWNVKENTITDPMKVPPNCNIGLAHAYSGTMALDIDGWDDAKEELFNHGIDLNALYTATDAVIIHSGREGRGKLLYKMPFGMVLPSKKLYTTTSDGRRYNFLDFRCGTSDGSTCQDVLPPSVHPDTGKSYAWAGQGNYTMLPVIPDNLLMYWIDLISEPEEIIDNQVQYTTDWQDIESALEMISPDIGREEWVRVAMAMHHYGSEKNDVDHAWSIFRKWSAGSKEKFCEKDALSLWRSLKHNKLSAIKIATLFSMAKDNGYRGPEVSVIDVEKMFSVTEVETINLTLETPRPQVDPELFPSVLKRMAMMTAKTVGCDELVPLWSGVATVSGAIDSRSMLILDSGYRVAPMLWVMVLGDPSTKKSPGSKPMLAALEKVEHNKMPEYEQKLKEYRTRKIIYENNLKMFRKNVSNHVEGENEAITTMNDEPVEPRPIRYIVSDISSQQLIRVTSANPRGVLCNLDEMRQWVNKLSDYRSGEDRSCWVSGFEGGMYRYDRVSTTEIVKNHAVSIYGNLQPDVLKSIVSNLQTDGLLQRFIPVNLSFEKSVISEPDLLDKSLSEEWFNLIDLISQLPATEYTLSPEAYKEFRAFQVWHVAATRDEKRINSSDVFLTAFGKLVGLVGRLAFVFHVCDSPFSTVVNKETMVNVIKLTKTYIIPSLRFVFDNADQIGHFEQSLHNKIIENKDSATISMETLRRGTKLPNNAPWLRDEMILEAMTIYERGNWVKRVDGISKEPIWAINPQLKTKVSTIAKEIKEARQRVKHQTTSES